MEGALTPAPQSDAEATYAPRINKADALIDWARPAVEIDRQIRAYNPWPVAETVLDGERMRCWKSILVAADLLHPESAGPATQVGRVEAATNQGIDVRTGEGLLRLVELQMPGRRRMNAGDFARGNDIVGKVFDLNMI